MTLLERLRTRLKKGMFVHSIKPHESAQASAQASLALSI